MHSPQAFCLALKLNLPTFKIW